MKKQVITMAAIGLILVSCGGTKNTVKNDTTMYSGAANTTESATAQKENSSSTNDDDSVSVAEKASGGMAGSVNGSSGAMNNVQANSNRASSSMDYDQMFADLQMTDDQISTFRAGMEDFQDKQANMPSGEMLGTIENERTKQLENVLSDAQLEKYQEWESNNN